MSSIHSDSENGESTQFLVKIFYKTGSYPRHVPSSHFLSPTVKHRGRPRTPCTTTFYS